MRRDGIAPLLELALAAGRAIMAVHDTAFATAAKPDGSPVTAADLAANEIIVAGLHRHFPGVPVVAEESPPDPAAPGGAFFLVDPLDGTREFIQRNGEFTVNIAWVENGIAKAGVVHAPALGQLYWGWVGAGAWRQDEGGEPVALQPSVPAPAVLRVIGSRSHGGEALARWLRQLRTPHSFLAAGSSLKFCRLAEGAADVYPRPGPTSQWDTAAGQAVLEAAGGAVLDGGGNDLRYGPERPMINPPFIALADRRMQVPPLA